MFEEKNRDAAAQLDSPDGKKNSKRFIPIVGCIAAIGIACGVLYGIKGAPNTGSGGKTEQTELFYVKGNSLYGFDTRNPKKEPVEYTENFLDTKWNDAAAEYFDDEPRTSRWGTLGDAFQMATKDGKYHFILEDFEVGENSQTYTLLSQKGNEKPVRVDSQISRKYVVTDDNKVIYQKNGNLYVSDLTDRRKLDDDVTEFKVSADGTHVMWFKPGIDIYYQDIDQKTDRIRIEQGVYVAGYSENFDNILIWKDDRCVYLIQNQTEKKKLVENITNNSLNSFIPTNMEQAQFFCMGSTEDVFVSDWAEDDLITLMRSDESFARSNAWQLDTPVFDKGQLYYGSEGEMTLIEDGYCGMARPNIMRNQYLRSKIINSNYYPLFYEVWEPIRKITVSDAYSGITMEKLVEEVAVVSATYLCMDGKKLKLELGDKRILDMFVDEDYGRVYAVVGYYRGSSHDLVEISLEENGLGEIKFIDDGVVRTGIVAAVENNVYYTKYVEETDNRELYCNGHYLCSNISLGGTCADNSLFSIVDKRELYEGAGKYKGTLVKIQGEEMTVLAEDVSKFYPFNENSVLMISEYDADKQEGDLWYYDGENTRLVDTDVRTFLFTE